MCTEYSLLLILVRDKSFPSNLVLDDSGMFAVVTSSRSRGAK